MSSKKGMVFFLAVVMVCMLAACGSGSGGSGIPKNPGNVYRVITQDESGAPVKGVNIQFCSDITCYMGETDDNGIAAFEGIEEGSYTVHVFSVPDGYAEDETEYKAPGKFGDVTITVKKA